MNTSEPKLNQDSGNAKMLIATFTGGGWEVGLLKQREVEKVRERITHSLSAAELSAFQNGSAQMSYLYMEMKHPQIKHPASESYWKWQ